MSQDFDNISKEISEHMLDSDFNRRSHFSQFQSFKTKCSIWDKLQKILVVSTTVVYSFHFSKILNNSTLNIISQYLVLVFSILSTIVTIVLLFNNYDQKANEHWLAAQSYQSLYRDCQFFFNDHLNITNRTSEGALASAYRIRMHLNNLNLISPHISKKIFKKISNEMYPSSVQEEKKVKPFSQKILIKKILADFNYEFQSYVFDLYLFGSYLANKSLNSSDIDIAIVLKLDDMQHLFKLRSKVKYLRAKYLYESNIILDISTQIAGEFYRKTDIPFYSNVKNGEKLVSQISSSFNSSSVNKDKEVIINKIDHFIGIAQNHYKNDCFEAIIINSYFAYYHCMVLLLANQNVTWKSEKEMLHEFAILIPDIPEITIEDLEYYFESEYLKNMVAYNYNIVIKKEIAHEILVNVTDFKDRTNKTINLGNSYTKTQAS